MVRAQRRVIVGVDGLPQSSAALRWAAVEAQFRGYELVVVTACNALPQRPSAPDGPADQAPDDACRAMQAQLVAALPTERSTPMSKQVLRGDPVKVLTRIAGADDLLVLGTRGRGPLKTLALGSVARGCIARTSGPVVVVPVEAESRVHAFPRGPVVVGVDETPAAHQALRFAAEEAKVRGVPLLAVYVLDPGYAGTESATDAGVIRHVGLLPPLESAAAQLDVLVETETRGYGIRTRTIATLGSPAEELLQWAESAALLVVGTRGTGRVAAALLGSVSADILQRTVCPTAVMPALPAS